MVLTACFVLSPVIGLLVTVIHGLWLVRARSGRHASTGLDASVEASGPHDFAVRSMHLSSARFVYRSQVFRPALRHVASPTLPRPPHPVPYVRDDRDTPLKWDGMTGFVDLIWVRPKRNYF
jgi:hypothetical protein